MEKTKIIIPNGPEVFFSGPPLSEGPLPAFFYFALSAGDSLQLDPFSQPVQFLSDAPIRVFSLTLPGHEEGKDKKDAMNVWAEAIGRGENIIAPFLVGATQALTFLIESDLIVPGRVAAGGLSRGGFAATHFAAADSRIGAVVAFAPITDLSEAASFQHVTSPLIPSLSLNTCIDKLTHTQLRFYIGNRDTLVGTSACFRFIEQLVEKKYSSGERSPQAELILSPSVGYQGHGTLTPIFRDGAHWIKTFLLRSGT